ncbi:hypothetical protein D6D01_05912 [Aureobasidium pullulans]|uniref:DUF3669 domain-containing protein n=1 Tax=Aureobasidium pullulans TaxID=5580 RepID=A0A4V4JV10_AURPU|nr:hypothetical protein D6D01_05912 [Aureobasidium pullulans]
MTFTYTNDQGFPHHVCDIHGIRLSQMPTESIPSITQDTTNAPDTTRSPTTFTEWRSLGKEDCSQTRFLWKECYIQNRIHSALSDIPNAVLIPHSFWYTSPPDTWHFPEPEMEAYNTMCSERIPPLSRSSRNRLIDYAIPKHAELAKRLDTDCIARVYLGKHRTGGNAAHYSLKNLPLWLNVLKELGLPTNEYAAIMGQTLALLHWAAEIDANDIEFVLGSPRQLAEPQSSSLESKIETIAELKYNTSTRLGYGMQQEPSQDLVVDEGSQISSLWILDFDCCDAITMDVTGAEKAAVAVVRNDYYTPKPCQLGDHDYDLWKAFKDAYLAKGAQVVELRGLDRDLPEVFIQRLEVFFQMKKEGKELPKFHRGPFCAPLSQ